MSEVIKFYPTPSEKLEWQDANADQSTKLETKTDEGYELTLEQGNHWYMTGDHRGWSWTIEAPARSTHRNTLREWQGGFNSNRERAEHFMRQTLADLRQNVR